MIRTQQEQLTPVGKSAIQSSSLDVFCAWPICLISRSIVSAVMKRLFRAKWAGSCLRSKRWIGANRKSAAGRSGVPAHTAYRISKASDRSLHPQGGGLGMALAERSAFLPHQPPTLALPRTLLFSLTFVIEFLATSQGELDLGTAFLIKIEFERHQSHALALDRTDQSADLAPVQQQFSWPFRRMVEAVGLQIFRNIGIDKPDFAATRIGVGFGDCRFALSQRFDLGARQRQTGLKCFVNKIIEACLAIIGDDAQLSFRFVGSLGCHASDLSGS